jgi:hypothetical protein
MKTRITTAIVSAPVLGALGLGLGPGLSGPAGAATTHLATATRASATAQPRPVVMDCSNKPVTRPGTYVLACADANDALVKMTWTSWTPKLASGYGTERLNLCQPNCAEGKFRDYPVLAAFWGTATINGHPGEQRYTTYTLIYPGARPPYYSIVNGKVVVTYPVTRTDPLWP